MSQVQHIYNIKVANGCKKSSVTIYRSHEYDSVEKPVYMVIIPRHESTTAIVR